MYIVKLHIILKDDQKTKQKKLNLSASERLHWLSHELPRVPKVLGVFSTEQTWRGCTVFYDA